MAEEYNLPLTRDQMVQKLLHKFLWAINTDPSTVPPVILAQVEADIDQLVTYEIVMTDVALDKANEEINDLKGQLQNIETVEDYSRDITYQLGVSDGIQQARSLTLAELKDEPEVKKRIEKKIPKKDKSPLTGIDDVYFGPE